MAFETLGPILRHYWCIVGLHTILFLSLVMAESAVCGSQAAKGWITGDLSYITYGNIQRVPFPAKLQGNAGHMRLFV